MRSLLILLLVLSISKSFGQSSAASAIRSVLSNQVKAWNTGNLDSFMVGYWQSDSLLFIGKSGPKYGYKTTLNNYKKSYKNKAEMGKLHFDILNLKSLSSESYFVAGKWSLQRSVGNLQGYFTLLFQFSEGKWVIIADHST